ncbi:Mitochondrial distribution and morphology protein 12 [Tulasnella sp. 403]|nr:Mitochondrial distribution and morphology protein 12 [Tulasnella sp. 403]
MATVDLDWPALDESLANTLVTLLNKHLVTATRPSFLGPIKVLGFEFGTTSPDVEVVDIQDIYPDFLEDDETPNQSGDSINVEGVKHGHMGYDPNLPFPPKRWSQHVAEPSLNNNLNNSERNPLPRSNSWGIIDRPQDAASPPPELPGEPSLLDEPATSPLGIEINPSNGASAVPSTSKHPDLQLHLHVSHHSNLRITLSTSLLINYPSPAFMSLPIKLSIVGAVFNGEVVVAYEGSRRRVHLCILDDQDPTNPLLHRRSPGEPDIPHHDMSSKPLPVGQRILPNIFIESEIGQVDKHVLKNVSKVERFIQDILRKLIEDELVYPNFQTIVLGDTPPSS